VASLFKEMEAVLLRAFEGRPAPEWARTADLRYGGQSWEIEVALPDGAVDREALAALRERFEDEHEVLYGVRGRPGSPVEIRAVRLAALGLSAASPSFDMPDPLVRERRPTRQMWLGGDVAEVPVRSRVSIGAEPVSGPLLVDEYDTTVVVPAGWSVRRHEGTGTLVLETEAAHG
jgi:N-methylhydantoinase A